MQVGQKTKIAPGQHLAGLPVRIVSRSSTSGGLTVEVTEAIPAYPAYIVGTRMNVMPYELVQTTIGIGSIVRVKAAAIADHQAPHYEGVQGKVINDLERNAIVLWDRAWTSMWRKDELEEVK